MTTRTLVINPPFLEPHRPPISCAIIGEVARLQGHEVVAVDLNINLFNKVKHEKFMELQNKYLFSKDESCANYLTEFINQSLPAEFVSSFDWILVSVFSDQNYPLSEIILRHCKTHSHAKVVVGGPGIADKSDFLLQNKFVNYCICGEGEIALKELFEGNDQYPGINGTPPVQIEDIENLPLPNYDFFNFGDYDWLLDKPDVFIYGSRGCVRSCTFCDVASLWPKFRWRSGLNIANEMIMNYEKYGVQNFYFADSLLNGNLKEFKIFLDKLSSSSYQNKFRWGGYAIIRPRKSHPAELFDQIQSAGGHFMSIGVETGVDRIRLEMKKHFTNDDIEWHLEQSQRIKLQNLFLMITSWYNETLQEHEEYLKIFQRWQNFAVDGTIHGIALNPPLGLMDNTPLQDLVNKELFFQNNDQAQKQLKTLMWINPKMPELSFKERYRRTIAIAEEAIKYNWNITNREIKLREIKSVLEGYHNL
jgi:hypothetical protein